MCGRYALTLPPDAVRQYFGYVDQPNFPPRYNIAPTQPIAIMRSERSADGQAARRFALVRWGLLPPWVKDVKAFPLIINARDEGLVDKPSFRGAMRHRRCIVIADAFYEWLKTPMKTRAPKRPFMIRRPDRAPLAFAGLWEHYLSPDGAEIETACIVTTSANGLVAAIHDRMPVILEPKDFATWLDVRAVEPREAMRLVRPAADEALELIEIGPAIGRVANDSADVQTPVAARRDSGLLDD